MSREFKEDINKDKKVLVERQEVLEKLKNLLGYCDKKGRVHSYSDYINSEKGYDMMKCVYCGQNMDEKRVSEARGMEKFLMKGVPWTENPSFTEGMRWNQ